MAIAIRKLLLMLLVICFQTQAVATMALSCAHSGPGPEVAAPAVCHQPSGSMADTSDTKSPERAWIDCQSCHLGCTCGGFAFLMPIAFGIGSLPDNAAIGLFQGHFYRFVPDLPQRPPISVLA